MNKTILLLLSILLSCEVTTEKSAQGDWIKGIDQDKIETIERQFRGFDMAMVETGYRYQELYWAGRDENWEYASYQLSKIQKTIKNGLERRPKRAKSADHFLSVAIPEMKMTLQKKDTSEFNKQFTAFTNSCISCHNREKVPFFSVKAPLYRLSPIRK